MISGKREKPFELNMPFGEALERFVQSDPREVGSVNDQSAPLPLVEDENSGNRFLVYATERGIKIDLEVNGQTFWASEQQMADMFAVTRQNINLHVRNIFKEGELLEEAVCKETLRTGRDGKRYPTKLYDLNAVISVGYRVGGKNGTMFRIWATDKLFRYLTHGFVIDSERLKAPADTDRVAELREIIRDIRASEANIYAELRRICAMCKDYEPTSDASREFYIRMQTKLYWAVTSCTPSMILRTRADAKLLNMGIKTWPKDEIRQVDATTAKNFLGDGELKELNRLTTILLDIFEDQLAIGKLTLMSEAASLLDAQLRGLNRPVLTHGGTVSHAAAEDHAKAEYRKFDADRRAMRVDTYAKEVAALKDVDKGLPKSRDKMKPR